MIRVILILAMLGMHLNAHAKDSYTFAVVPQQAANKLARTWIPILKHIAKETGVKVVFKTDSSIPEFEAKLASEQYDIAYMNPYHYVAFHDKANYHAFAKAKDKKIKGIIVANQESGISNIAQLQGKEIAFPSPAAFAASILIRSYLTQQGISITPRYVNSHDSVYTNVALGRYDAGGGVMRTLKAANPNYRNKLTVIHTTEGFTPHALAAHKRVPNELLKKIFEALRNLEENDDGRQMLKRLKIKGIEEAKDSDWNDVRALKIDLIN